MPSLSQLLTDHGDLLVLDAASTQLQAGLFRRDDTGTWRTTPQEAGRGLFDCTRELLADAQLRVVDIGAFIYCEGPGSMLGIRTVAMALRTWQILKQRPVFAYRSLAIAGYFEWSQKKPREFAVIADARRDTWHRQIVQADGQLPPLQRVSAAELGDGEWVTPENFRAWSRPPHPAKTCPYDLARIFPVLKNADLFRQTETPDAFQHEAPEYKKSPAKIHSIETADRK
jgi:tRNA threonylcarbamoyladenosine biosynthesis protein TsaB